MNYIGIDLGTTKSTVSIVNLENLKLETLPIFQYDKNFEYKIEQKYLDSTIYIKRHQKKVYTGEFAKKIYSLGNHSLNVIKSVKTRIGGEAGIQIPLETDENNIKNYSIIELTATLLKTIYDSLLLQDKITPADIITITVPARFNSDERIDTLKASKLAGFNNVTLLDEATSVLLNYLNDKKIRRESFKKEKKVLVYDIGGGMLDISLGTVQYCDDFYKINILGISKITDFGGDNIDQYIAAYFLEEFEKINEKIEKRSIEEQSTIISRTISMAEKVKIEFNDKISKVLLKERKRKKVKVGVDFEIIDNLSITDLTLTDELLKDVLYPVIEKNGLLITPIKEILDSANLDKEDIDFVILTGGSGKFYLIQEVLNEYFNDINQENIIPINKFIKTNIVSVGAAINSYNKKKNGLEKIELIDRMNESILVKFDKLVSTKFKDYEESELIQEFTINHNKDIEIKLEEKKKKYKKLKLLDELPIDGIFHMSHINNLKSIFENGIKSRNDLINFKFIDICDEEVNSNRSAIHDYVPLYFNPFNPMWHVRKNSDIVLLKLNKEIILEDFNLFSEKNAARGDTKLVKDLEKLKEFDWNKILDTNYPIEHWEALKPFRQAETLVKNIVNKKNILEVWCQNTLQKDKISKILSNKIMWTYLKNEEIMWMGVII